MLIVHQKIALLVISHKKFINGLQIVRRQFMIMVHVLILMEVIKLKLQI